MPIAFTGKLTAYCEHIAALPDLLGRARNELRAGYRSLAHGNHVIFFRYVEGDVPRATVEIIYVVDGARLGGFLLRRPRRLLKHEKTPPGGQPATLEADARDETTPSTFEEVPCPFPP